MSKRDRHAEKVARLAKVQREQSDAFTQLHIMRDLETQGLSLADLKALTKACEDAVDRAIIQFLMREKNNGQPLLVVPVEGTKTQQEGFFVEPAPPPDKERH